MSSIKLNRACKATGYAPTAQASILESIPAELISGITAKQLAQVMGALNDHWHKAVAHTEQTACADGCIWDNSQQRLRDIA